MYKIDIYKTFHYLKVVKRLGRKRLGRKRLNSETSATRKLSIYHNIGRTKSRFKRSRYKFREPISEFDDYYEDPILYTNVMATSDIKPQNFNYFLVLDFEATCKKDAQIHPQEIIEFPVLKVNAKTLKTDAVFHQYVQPRVNRVLTDFCTQLTGITQEKVDGQPFFEDTLKAFQVWMEQEGLLDPNVKFLFVTCGDWDLNKMLTHQCEYFNVQVPGYFKSWLNIKKAFAEIMSTYPKGIMAMITGLNLTHTGRHHSGIDDCGNIGNILCELIKRGYVAKPSGHRQ